MLRVLSQLLLATALPGQPVPSSLLNVELDSARRVLQIRNNYNSDAISIVVGHRVGYRYSQTRSWDAASGPEAEPLASGAVRDISNGALDWENWDVLAVIYADGYVAGSPEVIQSLIEGHQIVARQLEKAIGILNTEPDVTAAVESWFAESRRLNGTNRRSRRFPGGAILTPGPIFMGPVMAQLSVPRYVKNQLDEGVSRVLIVTALTAWQSRLQKYQFNVAFV
jgi:hypothetical protein